MIASGRSAREGIPVSRLGYGAAPLGNVYGDIEPALGIASVHRAIDLGITFFDVSPYYGHTLAEEVLGSALLGRRHEVVLCTKAGRYGSDTFDFSAERIIRSAKESCRRLRTDYLDILLTHDIEFGAPGQILGETIDALQQLKIGGICRLVGVSAYPLAVLRRAIEARDLDVVISYCHYCLFNTQLEDVMAVAERRRTAVINASPLGMGLPSDDGPPASHPASPRLREACARAAELCHSQGRSLAELALQFALREPRILTTVVGMVTPDLVGQNVHAVSREPEPDLLAQMEEILAPVQGTTWSSVREDWAAA